MVQAASLNVNLTANIASFEAGMNRARSSIKSFQSFAGKMGTAFGAAAAAIQVPLAGMVKSFADSASEVADLSKKTGVAASSLSALGYAGKLSGVSLSDLGGALGKMNQAIGNQSEVFSKLGLSLTSLKGMNTEQQFMAIADALANINDPAERTAIAMKIFGKSATNLFPLIDGGAESIRQMTDEARAMGIVISDEAAARGDALGDSFDKLTAATMAVANAFAQAIAPAYTKFNEQLVTLLSGVGEWIKENEWLATSLMTLGTALTVVSTAGIAINVAISGLTTVFAVVGKAIVAFRTIVLSLNASMALLMANPVTLLLGGLAALTAAFLLLTKTGNETGITLIDSLSKAFEEIEAKLGKLLAQLGSVGAAVADATGIDTPKRVGTSGFIVGAERPQSVGVRADFAASQPKLTMQEKFASIQERAKMREEERKKKRKRPEGESLQQMGQNASAQVNALGNIFGNAAFQILGNNIQQVRDKEQAAREKAAQNLDEITKKGPDLIQAGTAAAFGIGQGNQQQKTQTQIEDNTQNTYKEIKALAAQLSQGLNVNINNIQAFAP